MPIDSGAPVGDGTRPRILCVSFSPIERDARVLRQIEVLAEFGEVTTLGYGRAPQGVADHLRVPDGLASLPQTPHGVISLATRRFSAAEWKAPALVFARDLVVGRSFDLVVANDARALPVAFSVEGAPVWADLHEWAPEEQSHITSWRLLVAPFMTWLCDRYLAKCSAVSTVGPAIAELYRERFEVSPTVVRNARPYVEIEPTPVVEGRIRLVHSGVAAPERCIETLIDATLALDERFTLDLFLVFNDESDGYRRHLLNRAKGSERVCFQDPVAPSELPSALNAFDLGVYVLRPVTRNHHLMLPNKFFDFVQARLGFAFGPAAELDHLIKGYGLGVTTQGYSSTDLVSALSPLTMEQVREFKLHAHEAASVLNSEADIDEQRAIVRRLLG